jgi:pantoate--beta-alanine ligase
MKIFRDPRKFQTWCRGRRAAGATIALVPTMGYLHDGHLSLVAAAKRRKADEIVVSILVNPVQFGPNEDYATYPRDEKADLAKCRAAGVTAVFLPTPENMYLPDHSVVVDEERLSTGLCGARRPGHFRGVCTVVAKLFNLSHAHFAVFGQKDYQQAQIIRRLVRDLNFDLTIVVAPIVREASGLARSSRNTYLSAEERVAAEVLSRELSALAARAAGAPRPASGVVAKLTAAIEKAGLRVDYVSCVDGETLEPVSRVTRGVCVLVAAYAGRTRLIDNCVL